MRPVRSMHRSIKPIWVEGRVNRTGEHIKISYGAHRRPVALVACTIRNGFTVEFLPRKGITERLAGRILKAVTEELDRYLGFSAGPDSWAFARFHCDTAANACSSVHWSWQPNTAQRDAPKPTTKTTV